MSQRNKIQRLLRKGALATCLSLSVVCSSLSAVTAYAGPADDPAAAAPVIGPGGPRTTNANAGQQADNSYYNQTLSNPVVNPVDKYSYSQMVNDISALASRYPGTVTVNVVDVVRVLGLFLMKSDYKALLKELSIEIKSLSDELPQSTMNAVLIKAGFSKNWKSDLMLPRRQLID